MSRNLVAFTAAIALTAAVVVLFFIVGPSNGNEVRSRPPSDPIISNIPSKLDSPKQPKRVDLPEPDIKDRPQADTTQDSRTSTPFTVPEHFRAAANKWLPPELHNDLGLLGVAQMLESIDSGDTPNMWGTGDVPLEQILAELKVDDPASELLSALRLMDAKYVKKITDKNRDIMKTAMAQAIEATAMGKDVVFFAEEAPLIPSAQWVEETSKKRRKMLEDVYPEFAGDEEGLRHIAIGGKKPGQSRLIPLNSRDHPSYFNAWADLLHLRSLRREEIRNLVKQSK